MQLRRVILVGILTAAALGSSGCKRKKPPVPPPQANAPTVTQPAPEPAAPEETKPQPEVAQPAAPPQPSVEKPKPAPHPKRRHIAKKETPKQPPPKPAEKPRVVVPETATGTPPAPSGQLSASIPDQTATHQKLTTAQLLEAADYNLKNVTRSLTADEQAMVQHIRSYMAQSRQATQDGDTERAYNLALKAHLLSDEIAKR